MVDLAPRGAWVVWLGLLIGSKALAFGLGTSPAQAAAPADEELESHLAAQQKRLEDRSRSLPERSRTALDMAATLDRAAQAAPTADLRRSRWAQAVALLDGFNANEPKHPHKAEAAFQAAVYTWAEAQSWAQQAEMDPMDREARRKAVGLLDDAIRRLRSSGPPGAGGPSLLDQNRRFRLAQALADRAEFEPAGSPEQRAHREEAAAQLEAPIAEASLQGFAHLLRADLLGKLDQFDRAQAELRKAGKLKPPPATAAMLETQTDLAIARKQFEEAIKAIDAAKVDEAEKGLLAVRVRLAQRADLAPGIERTQAEAEVFRSAEALRKTGKPEVRLALMAVARQIERPEVGQPPEAWDALAEGYLALGNPERATELEDIGADHAARQGRRELAATLRNRAGAIMFQAGKYARADKFLTQVFDDPEAGTLRPKAGLLRILARARGLALGQAGCTREGLLEALTAQLREYPNDPTAGEARWLLGKLKQGGGDRDEAIALWSAIPHGDPRWLQARVAVVQLLQDAVEVQLLNDDRAQVRHRLDEAQKFLAESLAEGAQADEKAVLELSRARLLLTPGAARPEEALQLCDRLLGTAGPPGQRERARTLRLVALAQLGRFVEAEREAKAVASANTAGELLDLARLLDHSAGSAESDLYRRRLGQISRTVATSLLAREPKLTPAERAEARLRLARGLLFSGAFEEARRTLQAWAAESEALPDGLLDDLADTYTRLDAFTLAVDVYRLRAQHARPGSLPWFAARYGQALAYYRAGKSEEARRLIDATAILHPDLGGGALKAKFERLSQRLQND